MLLNDSSCAPAHNTPLPVKRSPPASFKRLLGIHTHNLSRLYALQGVAHTRHQWMKLDGICGVRGEDNESDAGADVGVDLFHTSIDREHGVEIVTGQAE